MKICCFFAEESSNTLQDLIEQYLVDYYQEYEEESQE